MLEMLHFIRSLVGFIQIGEPQPQMVDNAKSNRLITRNFSMSQSRNLTTFLHDCRLRSVRVFCGTEHEAVGIDIRRWRFRTHLTHT